LSTNNLTLGYHRRLTGFIKYYDVSWY
jgi:hypothetical protein